MQLHRARGNDWDTIATEQRNRWQAIASRTGGFVSPGNIITVIGGLLVAAGLILLAYQQNTWLAVALLLLGRLADLADGWTADRTGTKSPVGETFDAVIDKLELLGAVVVLWATALLPDVVFAALLLHVAYNSGLSVVERTRGRGLHPSRSGKLAAALEWIVIPLYVVDAGNHVRGGWHTVVFGSASILFVVIICLALVSSLDYTRQLGRRRDDS
jgi:phosphatidylglycerophosphate synthase